MLGQIATGFYNNLTNKEVDLFTYRINICRKCSNIKEGLLGEMCKICGCVLQSKTRVKEATCPENKW